MRPERPLPGPSPSLHQVDFDWQGYEWLELHDWENSVLAFLRRAKNPDDSMVVVCNFTPVVRENYRIGVPGGGYYREILNTDAESTAARTSATRAASGPFPSRTPAARSTSRSGCRRWASCS